jgi:hypothetical protein
MIAVLVSVAMTHPHPTIQFKIRPNRGGEVARSCHNSGYLFVCYLFCKQEPLVHF